MKERTTEEMTLTTNIMNDIVLTQSNTFTLAHFDYTAQQLDMLLLIIEELQPHMTHNPELFDVDAKGKTQSVVIDLARICGRSKWDEAVLQAKGFMKNYIDFKFKKVSGRANLASVVLRVEGTSRVRIDIPEIAMAVLCYIGKGSGATFYQKATALALKGKYDKRLYSIACAIEGRAKPAYFELEEFRSLLGVRAHLYKETTRFIQKVVIPNCDNLVEKGVNINCIPVRDGRVVTGFNLSVTPSLKVKKDEKTWQLADGTFVKYTTSTRAIAPTAIIDSIPLIKQLITDNKLAYISTTSEKIAKALSYQSNISALIHVPSMGGYFCIYTEYPTALTFKDPRTKGSAPMFPPVLDKKSIIEKLSNRQTIVDIRADQIENHLSILFDKEVLMWGAISPSVRLSEAKSYYYITKS